MTDAELRERLRATQTDADRDAEQRAWQIVRSAYSPAEASSRHHRFRITLPAMACTVAIVAVLLAVASSPRDALARWIRDAIGLSTQPHSRPVLGGLPSGGQLLVNSPAGPWIVHADGSPSYLGPYTAAAWSPHSLYVVAWHRAELAALDPNGRVEWVLTAGAKVTVARWSPDGYRISYIAGRSLDIVAGDGSDSHQLASHVKPVTPAWQPHTGSAHRIAFVDQLGDIELRNADTLALLWRIKPPTPPRQLLWSPDGTRLLAIAARQLSIYNTHGHLIATETILRAPWFALPLGVGLLVGAWALLARLQMLCLGAATPDRGPAPGVLALLPVWLMLAVVLVLGLAMPAPVTDWLRAASG